MLSEEQVKKIAELARIGLKDEEIEGYQKDLSAVLDFFRELETIDTENVNAIGHITGRVGATREDRAEDFGTLGKESVMKNVPQSKDGFVKVKSVF